MKKLILPAIIATVFASCEIDVTDKVKTDAYDGTSLISVSGSVTDVDYNAERRSDHGSWWR